MDWGRGDVGTWGRGDVGTWGRGAVGILHLFRWSRQLIKTYVGILVNSPSLDPIISIRFHKTQRDQGYKQEGTYRNHTIVVLQLVIKYTLSKHICSPLQCIFNY